MEEAAARSSMLNQLLRVHKPAKKSTADDDHVQAVEEMMSISKPVVVITRSHSASRAEAFQTKQATTTTHTASSYLMRRHAEMSKSRASYYWDCGSSLYDSFELNSLNHQLDLAIKLDRSSGTRSTPPPFLLPAQPRHNNPSSSPVTKKNNNNDNQLAAASNKKKSRSSRVVSKYSLNKILRSVFGSSSSKSATVLLNKKTDSTTTTMSSPYMTKVKKQTSASSSESSSSRNGRTSLYNNYDIIGSKSMRELTTIPEIDQELLVDNEHYPKFSVPAPDATPTVLRRAVSERFS